MTIGNAMSFMKRGLHDSALRKRLNAASDVKECENILAGERLIFSAHDFDEAFHHLLTQCQEEEGAGQIKEFKLWWDLLLQSLGNEACSGTCSGCCG